MRFGRFWSLPEISHINETDHGLRYHCVEGVTGFGFKVPLLDLEEKSMEAKFQIFSSLVQRIPKNHWLKIILQTEKSNELKSSGLSRFSSLQEIGRIQKSLFLFFESDSENLAISTDLLQELGAKNLSKNEIQDWFYFPRAEKSSDRYLDFGSHLVGVLRLRKAGTDPIDWDTLARLQENLPYPYEITCSLRPLSRAKVDFWLRGKLNRDQFSNDVTTHEKVQATAETLRDLSLYGADLFEWEWILKLPRLTEGEVRQDLLVAQRILSALGDCLIETFGSLPSFIASRPGAPMHVAQKELFPTVTYLLPISSHGESSEAKSHSPTTCLIHRKDGSLHGFDLFDRRFLAFNAIVSGKTGSGKSVFGNILSRALLSDPELHLIKVDVGGSYRRECALYGGIEIGFHLDKPSGVDPLAILGEQLTNEKLSILTEFLSVLALDDGEETLSKSVRGAFEEALRRYFSDRPLQTSLQDFIEKNPALPRIQILRRFSKGGVFENAIRIESFENKFNRYIYYNFENIHGASNKDYATAVMAAVIASVNLKMIALSEDTARASGSRLVFFCDETKFFIDRNAAFFLLTTANFRKFGHSVVLTGQNIEDFFLKRNGDLDRGLILNSPIRILFENQSKSEFLKSEFGLNDEQVTALGVQAYRGSDFRQFVLQDDLGTRLCFLYLTLKEKWEMTSTRTQVDQIEQLKRTLPWITDTQAIEIILLNQEAV